MSEINRINTVTIRRGSRPVPHNLHPSDSPLWMVTKEPALNELVTQLQQLRVALMDNSTSSQHHLRFSRQYLEEVRLAFAKMILQGEEQLHRLAQLLCETFFDSYQMHSVVIGEVKKTYERFTIIQTISINDLYSTTDIDLGNRQINKLQFCVDEDADLWSKASLVANMVEYQPTEPNRFGIHRVVSRIKAEEELWNKVVDEIFDLDRIVVRDKKLRRYSRYVKDVFGLKIIVGEASQIHEVHDFLQSHAWSKRLLQHVAADTSEETRYLQFLEVKDYLSPGQQKQSGWEAVKSVVRWGNKTFEIQIQPLRNFLREREVLTKESHLSFKANRERVRQQVAQQLPLFRFYQDLLRWLFLHSKQPPPKFKDVTLTLVD